MRALVRGVMSMAIVVVAGILAVTPAVRADVKLPSLISDHMVLQGAMLAPIWGMADPGENVAVKFRDREYTVTTGSDGKWRVYVDPMDPGGPFDMTITGRNSIRIADVLVGEVWVCSGQSNMQWTVSQAMNPEEEKAGAQWPQIRVFTVRRTVADRPQDDFAGQWEVCSPDTVPRFSAVGYYFGREVHRTRKVPVGLIHSSWGGTPAESWTSEAGLRAERSLDPIQWNWQRQVAEYPTARARHDRQLKEWEEQSARAKTENRPAPQRPAAPRAPTDPWMPSGLFNAMIAPMTSYAIRGAIWYQGESNASPYRALEYRRLFQTMIEDWRRSWGQPFPFLFVQLANYMQRTAEPGDSQWAELRESQMSALGLPNTGMAVAIDIGEANDIHPKNKQEVGRRLALAAQAIAYDEKIVGSGPVYEGMSYEGNRIRIRFRHAGSGLEARGAKLEGFAIAGRDRKFVWAEARIDGDTILVSSPEVSNPVAVRYAWADNPSCNLYNKEGLPASPFRTDDWSSGASSPR